MIFRRWSGRTFDLPTDAVNASDFVVHAGDIEYYDKPKPWAWTVELMRFKWARLFSMPRNRTFYSQHTTYFIKDDHDTLKNDCWPGRVWRGHLREVSIFSIRSNFPPAIQISLHPMGPGCGDLVAGRQRLWSSNRMEDGRKNRFSEVTKRLGCNLPLEPLRLPSSWCSRRSLGDRPNKKDNHANEVFAQRARLRTLFSSVDGIILFCGDRHWQYASEDPTTGLWEFGCGPGSARHQLGWRKAIKGPSTDFCAWQVGLSGDAWRDELGQPRLVLASGRLWRTCQWVAFPR